VLAGSGESRRLKAFRLGAEVLLFGYRKQKVEVNVNVQPKKSAAERLAEILDLARPTG
jgi:hypothetical protein